MLKVERRKRGVVQHAGKGTSGVRESQRVECSELFLESAACEGEGGVANGAAPVALDGVGGAAGVGEDESEGTTEMAKVIEKSVVWVAGVAEGDLGEFKAIQVGSAVAPAHARVEDVSFDVTLKAARGVDARLWKEAGAKLGFG